MNSNEYKYKIIKKFYNYIGTILLQKKINISKTVDMIQDFWDNIKLDIINRIENEDICDSMSESSEDQNSMSESGEDHNSMSESGEEEDNKEKDSNEVEQDSTEEVEQDSIEEVEQDSTDEEDEDSNSNTSENDKTINTSIDNNNILLYIESPNYINTLNKYIESINYY